MIWWFQEILDSDNDNLPDWWEIQHGLDPNDDGSTDFLAGPLGDVDNDNYLNIYEFMHQSAPE